VIQTDRWAEEASDGWHDPYSLDLRERVVRSVAAGASCRATAAKFEVSVSFVVKLMQRWRRRGTVAPDRYGGWKRSPLVAHADRVLALVAALPDQTLEELRVGLAASGVRTSRSALGRFLHNQGLTRKKRPGTPPSGTARMAPRRGPRGDSGSRR
jgi:transposase